MELQRLLRSLKPREAEIIGLYYGLDGNRPLTLWEIGNRYHLTRERVRQIKDKALKRISRHPITEQLRPYLG